MYVGGSSGGGWRHMGAGAAGCWTRRRSPLCLHRPRTHGRPGQYLFVRSIDNGSTWSVPIISEHGRNYPRPVGRFPRGELAGLCRCELERRTQYNQHQSQHRPAYDPTLCPHLLRQRRYLGHPICRSAMSSFRSRCSRNLNSRLPTPAFSTMPPFFRKGPGWSPFMPGPMDVSRSTAPRNRISLSTKSPSFCRFARDHDSRPRRWRVRCNRLHLAGSDHRREYDPRLRHNPFRPLSDGHDSTGRRLARDHQERID